MIGDQIDKKYDQQLNQALDAIIYEVVKNNVLWKSFRRTSQKLTVQGQHMQDGIFMILCFARRLLECVPNMRDTTASYTEMVMDNYAADLILDVGGWTLPSQAPLMAHYSQTEASEDYDDWDDIMTQLHQQGTVDTFGLMGYDLFTPDPKYAEVSLATTSEPHHPTTQKVNTSNTPGWKQEVRTSEMQAGSYFFHSRSSSSSTIRIVTGEEDLSQPDDSPSLSTRFRRQHGHSRSSSLTNPPSTRGAVPVERVETLMHTTGRTVL